MSQLYQAPDILPIITPDMLLPIAIGIPIVAFFVLYIKDTIKNRRRRKLLSEKEKYILDAIISSMPHNWR